jgi:hypothetical protein
VPQIYLQALGSLFLAFYNSLGYGRGNLTLLHTGNQAFMEWLMVPMPDSGSLGAWLIHFWRQSCNCYYKYKAHRILLETLTI